MFDLDDDGFVLLKNATPPDERLGRVRAAVYDCPTDSISFVEEDG